MKQISAQGLIDILKQSITHLPDSRKGNAIKYSITDAVLAAFSVFFTQSPSFLSYQRDMQQRLGSSNAHSLFSMDTIPTDNQIRNILDQVNPSLLTHVFHQAFKRLRQAKLLTEFRVNLGAKQFGYLIALDGTGYFSSDTIHCESCTKKTSKKSGKTGYSHQVLLPALVKPGKSQVIPLTPEFVVPQDGHKKQDCENAAVKRWLAGEGSWYANKLIGKRSKATILGDDLYSRQPVIEAISQQGFNYLLVCKETSHPWMYNYLNALEVDPYTKTGHKKQYLKPEDILHTYATKEWNGQHHITTTYRFATQVPLKDSPDTITTNWVEITQTRETDGKQLYKNAFITDHPLSRENIPQIVEAGRARWKVENEDINTLKTKGYHFTHNYGHGKKHLSSLLVSLIIIAYLYHTLLDLGDQLYKEIRELVSVRVTFFNHIKTLTAFFKWESWDQLFKFMHKGLNDGPIAAPG